MAESGLASTHQIDVTRRAQLEQSTFKPRQLLSIIAHNHELKVSALEEPPKISSEASLEDAHETLYATGHKLRCEVTGEARVAKTLETNSSEFSKPMQDFVTEAGWGMIWSRPGLERKTRSLLNIAMLSALNRGTELGVHVRGALNNGASELEIREVLIQVAGYVGMPAGLESTRIAERVINEMKAEKERRS